MQLEKSLTQEERKKKEKKKEIKYGRLRHKISYKNIERVWLNPGCEKANL